MALLSPILPLTVILDYHHGSLVCFETIMRNVLSLKNIVAARKIIQKKWIVRHVWNEKSKCVFVAKFTVKSSITILLYRNATNYPLFFCFLTYSLHPKTLEIMLRIPIGVPPVIF